MQPTLVSDAVSWLKQGHELQAASVLEQADVEQHDVENVYNLDSQRYVNIIEIVFRVPRTIYDELSAAHKQSAQQIQQAFRAVIPTDTDIRKFQWRGRANAVAAEENMQVRVERLQQIYIDISRHDASYTDERLKAEFKRLRETMTTDPTLKEHLPEFVSMYEDLSKFWPFIKSKDPTYAGRRIFITQAFKPVKDWLATNERPAVTEYHGTELLSNPSDVKAAWEKVKSRLNSDPDGAITAAVSFLGTVMHNIHDAIPWSKSESLSQGDDLPMAFKKLRKDLRLDADRTTNDALMQAGQGITSIISSLATIRNREGDAHGKAPTRTPPDFHLAEMSVNLAGAIATYLTKEFQRQMDENGSQ
jgi:hypothetical protein